ncbi:MAG: hypothetical protein ABW007_02115 [Chitinophagaceae bacterium]
MKKVFSGVFVDTSKEGFKLPRFYPQNPLIETSTVLFLLVGGSLTTGVLWRYRQDYSAHHFQAKKGDLCFMGIDGEPIKQVDGYLVKSGFKMVTDKSTPPDARDGDPEPEQETNV